MSNKKYFDIYHYNLFSNPCWWQLDVCNSHHRLFRLCLSIHIEGLFEISGLAMVIFIALIRSQDVTREIDSFYSWLFHTRYFLHTFCPDYNYFLYIQLIVDFFNINITDCGLSYWDGKSDTANSWTKKQPINSDLNIWRLYESANMVYRRLHSSFSSLIVGDII